MELLGFILFSGQIRRVEESVNIILKLKEKYLIFMDIKRKKKSLLEYKI